MNRKVVRANLIFLALLSLFPVRVHAVSLHRRAPANIAVFCSNATLAMVTSFYAPYVALGLIATTFVLVLWTG